MANSMTATTAAINILNVFHINGGDDGLSHGIKVLAHIEATDGLSRVIEVAEMIEGDWDAFNNWLDEVNQILATN